MLRSHKHYNEKDGPSFKYVESESKMDKHHVLLKNFEEQLMVAALAYETPDYIVKDYLQVADADLGNFKHLIKQTGNFAPDKSTLPLYDFSCLELFRPSKPSCSVQ